MVFGVRLMASAVAAAPPNQLPRVSPAAGSLPVSGRFEYTGERFFQIIAEFFNLIMLNFQTNAVSMKSSFQLLNGFSLFPINKLA